MRIVIDTSERTLVADGKRLDLYGKEAFELISDLWLKTSWNQKYSYTFTWLGRPIIQHPEDLVRLQEVIFTLRPDIIIETGVAHGGSLIFYASLFRAMGKQGRVVGVDIEIRPQNRKAIEKHELASYITLVEGDSALPDIVQRVSGLVGRGDRVMVILDSSHAKAHVARELEAYAPLVSPGSYIVATDGIMGLVHDTPRGRPNGTVTIPRKRPANLPSAIPNSFSRSQNGGSMKASSIERSRLGPAPGSNESDD
jgi:cephalosporin hydroxylase